uniref:Uncharacterized protein n=1 Tax=Anopheles arabiensis TaxID=7173 RepID=A0A182IF61_ANOAR
MCWVVGVYQCTSRVIYLWLSVLRICITSGNRPSPAWDMGNMPNTFKHIRASTSVGTKNYKKGIKIALISNKTKKKPLRAGCMPYSCCSIVPWA